MSQENIIRVGDIIAQHPPVKSVDVTHSIRNALDLMLQENINTIAITGTPGGFLGSGGVDFIVGRKQYLGFLSMVDLLIYVSEISDINSALDRSVMFAMGRTFEGMSLWIEAYDKPLHYALEQLSKGCHHAFAFDNQHSNELPRMFSQIDILSYFSKHLKAIGLESVLGKEVGAIMTSPVAGVLTTTPLKDSMNALSKFRAIPVFDENRKLVSTLSSTDFTGQNYTTLATIVPASTIDYILFRNQNVLLPPVTIFPTQSLAEGMNLMLQHHIHRLWVVDQISGDALGVISVTDILREIYTDNLTHKRF